MRISLYVILFPFLIFSQNAINDNSMLSKKNKIIHFSYNFGMKFYTGNSFLNQQKFSREGVFLNFNLFSEKMITKKISLIKKSSVIFSNAFLKKIHIFSNFHDVEINSFNTRIPNILSCDINFSIAIKKKIHNFFSHSTSLKFRLWPLFYKKGRIFGGEPNSLGGLISSEEDGSFPGLEKTTTISYTINYLLNKTSSIELLIFINSDLGINSFNITPIYPGLAIQFQKRLTFNN